MKSFPAILAGGTAVKGDSDMRRLPLMAALVLMSCAALYAEPPATNGIPEEPDVPDFDAPVQVERGTNAPALESDREESYAQMEALAEVLLLARQRYVEEKTYRQLMRGALHGMLQGLDPHSAFLDEGELKAMQDDTAGKFSGVGIQIGMKKGMLLVIAPIEDTPGFCAGLLSGDAACGREDEEKELPE